MICCFHCWLWTSNNRIDLLLTRPEEHAQSYYRDHHLDDLISLLNLNVLLHTTRKINFTEYWFSVLFLLMLIINNFFFQIENLKKDSLHKPASYYFSSLKIKRFFTRNFALKDLYKHPPKVFYIKKVFLEISQNSEENTCAIASFLIKLQAWACKFIKKETLPQVFSCEFCEISKNTFSTEHLQTTLLDLVEKPQPATLLKKRLWHRCFPVNFTKFLRTIWSRTRWYFDFSFAYLLYTTKHNKVIITV